MAGISGKPVDNMLTGAKIRYRLGTSHNLREGYIISCSDGYAWITDIQTQQVAYIHKSGIIFDSIPNTGIRMPRADEIKYVGPVQTGKLESDQLESQLYDRPEAQKTGLHQEEDVLEQQRMAQSPRNYRLTQLAAQTPNSHESPVSRRSDKSPQQRTPSANGFYPRKDRFALGNDGSKRSPSSASDHHSVTSPRHRVQGGFYFVDDVGKLFFQQDSGLTFYVDSNNIFYPVTHRRKRKHRSPASSGSVDAAVGADPRLVPELFEGWTDEKGVWYPRSAAPRDRQRQGPKKRLFEDKARENPFLWQEKSMEERVQAQLEHYFSPGNLETDSYMKSLMDSRGYVEANSICSFRRMQHHHVSVGLVLQAAQQSRALKVKGTRIRAKNSWWLHMKRYVPAEEREDSEGEDEVKEVDDGTTVIENVKQPKRQHVNEDVEDVKGAPLETVAKATNSVDERKVGKIENE